MRLLEINKRREEWETIRKNHLREECNRFNPFAINQEVTITGGKRFKNRKVRIVSTYTMDSHDMSFGSNRILIFCAVAEFINKTTMRRKDSVVHICFDNDNKIMVM